MLIGLGSVAVVIKLGRRAAFWVALLAVIVQILIIGSLWLDWGYSWVNKTAISVILEKSVWMALAQAFAVVILIGFVTWGLRFSPYGAILAGIQAAVTLEGLFFAEMSTDTSFLGAPALFVMFGSTLTAFVFTAAGLVILPSPGLRWYSVVFGPRQALIDAIEGLSAKGFHTFKPSTVFESGAATGNVGGFAVSVTSGPSLLPLKYGLRIEVGGGLAGSNVVKPAFTDSETIASRETGLTYRGLSSRSFAVDSVSLSAFIDVLVGASSASPR